MKFKVIAAVTAEPVTLAEARLQLRLTPDDTIVEDAMIGAWITAARETAEHYTGRALAPQTLEAALDEFPCWNGTIPLPMPPVASVTSIKYTDTAGAEQTLAADQYALSTYGDSRTITPAYGVAWPTTQCISDAVRVRFVTGYEKTPQSVRAAILLLVAHFHENREPLNIGNIVNELPFSVKALLDTVKIWGF